MILTVLDYNDKTHLYLTAQMAGSLPFEPTKINPFWSLFTKNVLSIIYFFYIFMSHNPNLDIYSVTIPILHQPIR